MPNCNVAELAIVIPNSRYCGKTGAGIGFLLVSLLSCGILGAVTAILALISGIKMFCMTNEQFDQTYVLTTSSMPI